jgi:iron complex transport system substrate-binding protein
VYVVNESLSSGAVLYQDLGLTAPKAVKEISKTATANWNPMSLEVLAELDAEYLFIVNGKGISKEELLKEPVWADIPAVKNGHVYTYGNEASWLYTGTIANRQIIDNVMKSILNK